MNSLFKIDPERTFFSPISHLMDDVFGSNYFSKVDLGTSVPAVNIREGIKHYTLEMAIPGYNKDQFNIDVNDTNVITISGSNEKNAKEGEGEITRREYSLESFTRRFSLPDHIDAQQISASYENGILTITVPKKEAKKADDAKKHIEVK